MWTVRALTAMFLSFCCSSQITAVLQTFCKDSHCVISTVSTTDSIVVNTDSIRYNALLKTMFLRRPSTSLPAI